MKLKIPKSRCPHCRSELTEPELIKDSKDRIVAKRFYCGGCDSHWLYDVDERRMRRDD